MPLKIHIKTKQYLIYYNAKHILTHKSDFNC